MFAQTSTTITGTITDNDGLPIPGAAVMVKGTTTGTVTDFDGKYSINVPAGAETLLFRLVGMEDQDQLIAGRSVIDVVMASDVEELDDIVVVAYGSATEDPSLVQYHRSIVRISRRASLLVLQAPLKVLLLVSRLTVLTVSQARILKSASVVSVLLMVRQTLFLLSMVFLLTEISLTSIQTISNQ